MNILISAGEASGDLYAAELVNQLRQLVPEAQFFGCAGRKMRESGVRPVFDAERLSVVGLVEVLHHLPRIYKDFQRLIRAAQDQRPTLAILTDSPDFHLRVAKKLHARKIPVIYLVAPQAWAWRKGRVRQMRRNLCHLLCIFPFEEQFFQNHGVNTSFIGHPMAWLVKPKLPKVDFFRKHRLDPGRPLIAVLPGSRIGETARHLPIVLDAVDRIAARRAANFVWATPAGFLERAGTSFFRERISRSPIQVIEGETWDAMAHADLALAASGTVTMEAALLGTPMVSFYRVTTASWIIGRWLVDVPFFTMVNLVAGRKVVPELIQNDMTADNLADEALKLLSDPDAARTMREELAQVAASLKTEEHPLRNAARIIYTQYLTRQ